MSAGRLVAEIRYGHVAHLRATKIGDSWWFRIRLAKKSVLVCDCGGTIKYLRDALTYDNAWGGCAHTIALFNGHVTDDKRVPATGEMHLSVEWGRVGGPASVHFGRLTQLGKDMFWWRWAAKALETR